MKVILVKDVKDLGREGDMVDVSDGHARNFLFPQSLAVPVTRDFLKQREERRQAEARRVHKEMSIAGDLATQMDGFELVLQEKISEGGLLYAAVTKRMIVSALQKEGWNVDEDWIELEHPLKEPGEYLAKINLPHGFEAEIRIIIEGTSV